MRHAAARLVDAPALARSVARPHERDRAPVGRRGAKTAADRLARNRRVRKVGAAHAVENVLARGQAVDQRLHGEVALGQRIERHRAQQRLEAIAGRNVEGQARGTVGARPDHAGIERHVARLHAVADDRPVGGAGQIRRSKTAERGDGGRGCGRRQKTAPAHWRKDANGHGVSPVWNGSNSWPSDLTRRRPLCDRIVTTAHDGSGWWKHDFAQLPLSASRTAVR